MIRATITDRDAISQIKLAHLIAYLECGDYQRHRSQRDGVEHWSAPADVLERWETEPGSPLRGRAVTLPAAEADGRFSDQVDGIADALFMIAAVEDRSQLDVFVDLGGDLGR